MMVKEEVKEEEGMVVEGEVEVERVEEGGGRDIEGKGLYPKDYFQVKEGFTPLSEHASTFKNQVST